MRRFFNRVTGVLTLSYPLAVYFGVHYLEPWTIALVLAILLLGSLISGATNKVGGQWLSILAVLFCAATVWSNNKISLLFYPALVNVSLLIIFSASLFFPPPVVERLARMQNPDLPPKGVLYTRKVTQIWCAFFLLNGLTAAATAVWGSFAFWTLYNGLLAYILMGLLMGAEYWIRIRTQDYAR